MSSSHKKTPTTIFPFERNQPATFGQRLLLLKYPLFFKAVRHPDELPCELSHWGICCGPGWLPILDTAIEHIELQLQALLKKGNSSEFAIEVEQRVSKKLPLPVASDVMMPEPLDSVEPPMLPYCREISVDELGGLQISIASGYLCDEESSNAIGAAVFLLE